MSFIEEIKNFLGLSETFVDYKVTIFGEEGAYFENVSSIKSYSREKVEIFLKKGCVVVCGENLYIKRYYEKDLAICGKIKSLERK